MSATDPVTAPPPVEVDGGPPPGAPGSPAQPSDATAEGGLRTTPASAGIHRTGILLTVLGLTAVALFAGALALGSVAVPLDQAIVVLTGGDPSTPAWAVIIGDIRLPRAITAVVAGAGLSVSGLQLQTLFRNPLADPFVLGISSGASLGVALVSLGGGGAVFAGTMGLGGSVPTAVAAAVGAAVVLLAVLGAARRIRAISSVLIIGLMTGYLATSLVSLLLYFSDADDFRGFLTWSLGSFRGVTWSELQVLVPVALIGLVVAVTTTKGLNAMLLGERYAESVGVAVGRLRLGIIVSSSLLAGVVTAFTGPVAFIGLAVPHLCRSAFRTADHRVLMPAVVLMGTCVALITEILSGLPGNDLTLPLNAVTPLFGAPVVIAVLMRLRQSPEVALS